MFRGLFDLTSPSSTADRISIDTDPTYQPMPIKAAPYLFEPYSRIGQIEAKREGISQSGKGLRSIPSSWKE
jgi:hypothetical protein